MKDCHTIGIAESVIIQFRNDSINSFRKVKLVRIVAVCERRDHLIRCYRYSQLVDARKDSHRLFQGTASDCCDCNFIIFDFLSDALRQCY